MVNRQEIINLFKQELQKREYIYALWLEGSDGLGTADNYSDIDFWLDAEDGHENQAMEECLALLKSLGELDLVHNYDHPCPKIIQKNVHIKDTSEFLLIDICIQSHSRDKDETIFIEGDTAELPLVLFDKAEVITILPEPDVDYKQINKQFNEYMTRFAQQARMRKYILRGDFLEALAYYHSYVCDPIVAVFRLIFTPRHPEYGLVHISDHLPADIVERIESLYKIGSLNSISENQREASELMMYATAMFREKYDTK